MKYVITKYTFDKAKKANVKVKPSTNKLKKIDVFKNGVKIASVGGIRNNGVPYMDFPNYIKTVGYEKAHLKRKAYLARHRNEPKFKIVNNKKILTNSFWADFLLW